MKFSLQWTDELKKSISHVPSDVHLYGADLIGFPIPPSCTGEVTITGTCDGVTMGLVRYQVIVVSDPPTIKSHQYESKHRWMCLFGSNFAQSSRVEILDKSADTKHKADESVLGSKINATVYSPERLGFYLKNITPSFVYVFCDGKVSDIYSIQPVTPKV